MSAVGRSERGVVLAAKAKGRPPAVDPSPAGQRPHSEGDHGFQDTDTFDRYARLVRGTLDVPVALVTIIEGDRQVFLGQEGLPEPVATERETPIAHSFCRHVVADRGPLIAADVREQPRLRDNPSIPDFGVVGYAGWPLRDHRGTVIGSLCALDMERRDWSPEEVAVLEDLAAACSADLAQRGLRAEALAGEREARALSERSRTLLALSETLSSTRTLVDVARALEQTARAQLGCLRAGIWVREPEADSPPGGPQPTPGGPPERLVYTDPGDLGWTAARTYADLPLDETTPLGLALLQRGPSYLPSREALDARFPRLADDTRPGESRAWLPLVVRGHAFGVLVLVWPDRGDLSDETRVTVAALASYTAQAVQRARLLEERLDALLTLQTSMASRLPALPGLGLAARYLPAATRDEVGGDWYDAVVLSDGCTALVVGDVLGHDMEAAAAMGQLRIMLRTLAWAIGDAPSATVQRLDQAVAELGVDVMATLMYVHLEPPEHPDGPTQVLWSSAGHPPPLVLDPAGSARYLDGDPDLLLGVRPSTARHDHREAVDEGSTLLLYTDGLVERRGENLGVGLERLRASVERHAGLPLAALLDALRTDLVGRQHGDDVALLAVRVERPAQ